MHRYAVVAEIVFATLVLICIVARIMRPRLRRKAGTLLHECKPVRIRFLSGRFLFAFGVGAIGLQLIQSIIRNRPLSAEAYRGWETMSLTLAGLWIMNRLRLSVGGVECYSNGILFFDRLIPWETIRGYTWFDSSPSLRLHLIGDKTVNCAIGMEHRLEIRDILCEHGIPECEPDGRVNQASIERVLEQGASQTDRA